MFVLIHSPLVGPLTWQPVAHILQERGKKALAPALPYVTVPPFWKQHVQAVVDVILAIDEPIFLAGHSGGGILLPAIRETLQHPVAGYIFVDSNLPVHGKSRLEIFGNEAEVQAFREAAVDGLLPTWTAEDLQDSILDPELRQKFVAELRPMPLAVYEEPIPVFSGWSDAPCAYLQFSPVYDASAKAARQKGWLYRSMEGSHFHMLNAPDTVADALLEMAAHL